MRILRLDAMRDRWRAPAMPLQQSWTYGEVLARLGAGVERVAVVAPSGACGLAQVARRGAGPLRLALLSRGPVWDRAPADGEADAALRALGRAFLPLVATPERPGPGLPLASPRHMALLDLAADPAALRAGLGQKWRNRLTRAEGAGISVRLVHADPGSVDRLLAEDAAQALARGYRPLPARFTRAWLALDPGAALLAEASWRGRRVAAMLFLIHSPWASYHIGWTGADGRGCNAHGLLLWRAMLALRDEGIATLDLGEVNTEGAPGLARFKIGSGARVVTLGATAIVPPWSAFRTAARRR